MHNLLVSPILTPLTRYPARDRNNCFPHKAEVGALLAMAITGLPIIVQQICAVYGRIVPFTIKA